MRRRMSSNARMAASAYGPLFSMTHSARTHIAEAPWWIIEAVDKKHARLNCMHHLLGQIPYCEVERELISLPPRERSPIPPEMFVPNVY